MSRSSRIRKRARQRRRKHLQQRKLAQLRPLRKVSTAALFEEVQRRTQVLADIFEGSI